MYEYPGHNFGAVTAATAASFSIDGTFRGNPNIPSTARIAYAVVRNDSDSFVTIATSIGPSVVQQGERKRVEFPGGARFFNMIPNATTTSGQVTADIGIDGTRF